MSGKFERQRQRASERLALLPDGFFTVTRPLVASRPSTCWSVSCTNYGGSTFFCEADHA